jgi:hypothetical protein
VVIILNKKKNKDCTNLSNDLTLERKDKKILKNSGYDFVPRFDHWTNTDEQKLKVKEIEEKTKNN